MKLAYPTFQADAYVGMHWGHDIKPKSLGLDAMGSDDMAQRLYDIIRQRTLSARFQPIVDMADATIHGYEGLIRGPSDSPLHSPLALFEAARSYQMTVEVEHLCRQVVLESYAKHALACKLFLNVSPECLLQPNMRSGATLGYIHRLGLDPRNVVIELTESSPTFDYELLREATEHYRGMGFEIALDDLGEGFSSLRLWSELRPDYVKIDKHFIQGISQDAVKLQFVRSIKQIAEDAGCKVIAEGVENFAEFSIIRDLHIDFGQGYYFGRPEAIPMRNLDTELVRTLRGNALHVFPRIVPQTQRQATVASLLKHVPPVTPTTSNDEVFALFEADTGLHSLPVVRDGVPVGLISRYAMIDRFARPYRRELYGRRSCDMFMDTRPLIVESCMTLHALSDMITNMAPHHLSNGFIITGRGYYLGMGSGHALLRKITQMQLHAARYANPLTQLPGNVPINEHIDRLLQSGVRFWACYADIDNFKPYNDVYGFRKGDELIQFVGSLLSTSVDVNRDFVGHIGGDDFILLFQSEDWQERCQRVLAQFGEGVCRFYDLQDLERGGLETEDRQGNKILHPLSSLSIGIVAVEPGRYASHHEVAAAASIAKKQAKKIPGNSLFLERREAHGDSRNTNC